MSNDNCPHHWLIEPAEGTTSWGKCTLCGKRREFSNIIEIGAWRQFRIIPHGGVYKAKTRHYLHHTVEEDNPSPEWENGVKALEK